MNNRIIFFFLSSLILLIAYYPYPSTNMDIELMTFLLIFVLFSIIIFSLRKKKEVSKNQYLNLSNLFLLGFVIVHFQLYIDYVFDNININNHRIWKNEDIVIKSFIISVSGLIAFMIGYLSYKDNSFFKRKIREVNYYKTGVLVAISSIILLLYFYFVNPLYLIGFYGIEDMGTEATYLSMIFEMIIFVIVIQNCRNILSTGKVPNDFKEYIKSQGVFVSLIILIYLLSVILSGDRGPIISIGLCYFSGYYIITKQKLTAKIAIPFVIIGVLFLFILGEIRSLDQNNSFLDRLIISTKKESRFKETSILPATQVLASSVRTLHSTVDYIPKKHDFLYGRFQFQQIFGVIPFANSFLNLLFDDNHIKYSGSSQFITWIDQGEFPYSGEGSTCIADLYFDFGILGVILGMFLFGCLSRIIDDNLYSSNVPSMFFHVLIVCYLSNSLYISRSSILTVFKGIIWIYIIMIINKNLFNKIKS